jgi:NAD(P)-dependent dehydrogenase (short-subunit alcohol dehydrogenase family)
MSKILLILGAGPNIGASLAKAFASRGYKVATASRSPSKGDDGADLHVTVDLAKPETVPGVFERVRSELGGEVGVVVYNGECALSFLFLEREEREEMGERACEAVEMETRDWREERCHLASVGDFDFGK